MACFQAKIVRTNGSTLKSRTPQACHYLDKSEFTNLETPLSLFLANQSHPSQRTKQNELSND